MATERKIGPQPEPRRKGLPSEPPFVVKGKEETAKIEENLATGGGKLVDASDRFKNDAPLLTPEAPTVETQTRTKVEEEIEKVLEEQEQTQTGGTGGDGTGSGSGEKPPKKPGFKKKLAAWVSAGIVALGAIVGVGIGVSKMRNGGEGETQPGNTTSRTETIKGPETFGFDKAGKAVAVAGRNAVPAAPEDIQEIRSQTPQNITVRNVPDLLMPIPIDLSRSGNVTIETIYDRNGNFAVSLDETKGPDEQVARGQTLTVEKKGAPVFVPMPPGADGAEVIKEVIKADGKDQVVALLFAFTRDGEKIYGGAFNIHDNDFQISDLVKDAPSWNARDGQKRPQKGLALDFSGKPIQAMTGSKDDAEYSFSIGYYKGDIIARPSYSTTPEGQAKYLRAE